ncbi:hypothetical protein KC19_4G184100 [Ceratodon purpureus]|uniref:DNA topoisomerase 2 n=1 Tax=Ceratodon purpureus TaxID=3225 RepID=A0A8T0ICD0_CERPU|nr:hypothetical protein KC19_4G184100 [Ceratodon purpureus]
MQVTKAKAAGEKVAKVTKAKKVPLQSSSGFNVDANEYEEKVAKPAKREPHPDKSIEETYQKKTQLEHILLRPDTYVGSIEKHTQTLWVYEDEKMVNRSVTFVPGLYKIFDEILVNAADNKQRDPSMDTVKVEIDIDQNFISVYNNGDGVPVEIHKEEGVYVPEMIFGHLLTSSNYNDSEKKTTGGRNGYGAKLANIFSTEFTIETADGKRQRRYKQVFKNNMSDKSEPKITTCKSNENWTKVSFKPDLAKFNMTHLESDVVSLMCKRVMDIAGCLGKGCKVELNGKRLPVKSFQDYVGLYLSVANSNREEPLPRFYEKVNDRWEVVISLSDGQFNQVSFCNSIATIRGGTHVAYVADQIVANVMAAVNKKNKTAGVKPFQVKNHMWVFVNALIDNPTFDSQTKETLTTRASSFGSKCELSAEFLKKVAKCGLVDNVLTWADFKQSKELKKNDGAKRQRITGIPKLDDANDAGGKSSEQCTLILTEGDSAKALAMSGISVVGRDKYGVFPLRGKLLNVREASHKQIMDNAEITNIKRILGLQHGKDYDSTKSLRYGHLMIMTDQDHDGSHIKGLLINFIHSFWPSLLKIPSFLVEFITPIVKATNKQKTLSFYTMPEYEAWKESLNGETKGWTIKYYKGLGTSTAKEGKEYFRELIKHKKDFMWESEMDGDAIEMAFSKKKIEARKTWLRHYEPGTFLDMRAEKINYCDFVNKELILFSMADLSRSIPSMVDGLKPGQRKILFCCFKRNFVKQAKVAQFSGYVSEHSAYHHGEASLASTIIGMAQNFVGSNNINLLSPEGQFGTREQGGKNHASPRYIFTCLSPITRALFPQGDDVLLDYLKEDGQSIEPSWYCPIIPLVLVNGSEGIGTGWSSFVPNYNPREIVANIHRLLADEEMEPMHPWYKHFKGTIECSATKDSGLTYTLTGTIDQIDETTIKISELPVRKWTQDYKEFLDVMMTPSDKNKEPFIKDFREHNTDTKVHFELVLSEENMAIALAEGLVKKFKLTTTISTSNMHLFDAKGLIKKYDTPEQILEEFYHIRLELYVKRKAVQLQNLQYELLKVDNKVRFILGVVKGEIIVNNRKRADLLSELQMKGFTPFPKKAKSSDPPVVGADAITEDTEEDEKVKGIKVADYEYLLSMPIGSLTFERVEQLRAERDKMEDDVEELKKATPKQLWEKDLDEFLVKLDAQEAQEEIDAAYEAKHSAKEGNQNSKRPAPRKPAAPKAKKAEPVDEDFAEAVPAPRKQAAPKAKKTEPVDEDEAVPAPVASKPVVTKAAPKPRAKAAPKKPAKIVELDDSDDEDFTSSLRDRLASYNSKVAQPSVVIEDVEEEAPKVAKPAPKKRLQKLAAKSKEISPPSSPESVISQEKPKVEVKVRKIQVSPLNKKTKALTSKQVLQAAEAEAAARPARAGRRKVQYIISDSSSEDANDDSDDAISDFSDTESF